MVSLFDGSAALANVDTIIVFVALDSWGVELREGQVWAFNTLGELGSYQERKPGSVVRKLGY